MKPGPYIVDKLGELITQLNLSENEFHELLTDQGDIRPEDILSWVEKNFSWTPTRTDGEDVEFDDVDIDWK